MNNHPKVCATATVYVMSYYFVCSKICSSPKTSFIRAKNDYIFLWILVSIICLLILLQTPHHSMCVGLETIHTREPYELCRKRFLVLLKWHNWPKINLKCLWQNEPRRRLCPRKVTIFFRSVCEFSVPKLKLFWQLGSAAAIWWIDWSGYASPGCSRHPNYYWCELNHWFPSLIPHLHFVDEK